MKPILFTRLFSSFAFVVRWDLSSVGCKRNLLTLLAILLFGISFFLPSLDYSGGDEVGWECAYQCLFLPSRKLELDDFGWYYYSAFNLSNLAMVTMSIRLLTTYRKKAVPLGIVIAQGVLLLHVLSWPIILAQEEVDLLYGARGEVEVGYYLWFSTFEVEVGYYLWLLSMIIIFGLSISRESVFKSQKSNLDLNDGNGVVVSYEEDGTKKSRSSYKDGELVED